MCRTKLITKFGETVADAIRAGAEAFLQGDEDEAWRAFEEVLELLASVEHESPVDKAVAEALVLTGGDLSFCSLDGRCPIPVISGADRLRLLDGEVEMCEPYRREVTLNVFKQLYLLVCGGAPYIEEILHSDINGTVARTRYGDEYRLSWHAIVMLRRLGKDQMRCPVCLEITAEAYPTVDVHGKKTYNINVVVKADAGPPHDITCKPEELPMADLDTLARVATALCFCSNVTEVCLRDIEGRVVLEVWTEDKEYSVAVAKLEGYEQVSEWFEERGKHVIEPVLRSFVRNEKVGLDSYWATDVYIEVFLRSIRLRKITYAVSNPWLIKTYKITSRNPELIEVPS